LRTDEQVDRLIEDPNLVSAQQRAAITAHGNLFLLSRPGSGKTRTVGIRLARLASRSPAVRVAATSYTNIAVAQINDTVRDWGVVLGPQHYTGTIHEFLLRHVLYPFGHLDPVNLKRPFRLIGDAEWSGWPVVIYRHDQRKRLALGMLNYTADGDFKAYRVPPTLGLTKEQAAEEEVGQAKRLKRDVRNRGLVSLSDAMFYSQKLLEEHPWLCATAARRFEELIVDEVQDTSDVQMRCLELLHGSGELASLVLVGDIEQSIYGFQGARPELCEDLADTCGLTALPLTENFRSSQEICNVTCRFCGRDEPDDAVGNNRNAGIAPELLAYDPADPTTAVEAFSERIERLGIPPERAVVLVRARRFRDLVNGRPEITELNRLTLSLGRLVASHRERRTLEKNEVGEVEGWLAEMAWGTHPLDAGSEEARNLRAAVMRLLETLPEFDLTLAEWIDRAREAVKDVLTMLTDAPHKSPSNLIKKKAGQDKISSRDAFSTGSPVLWARTVHDAKGESHEAVLLVVEPERRGRRPQAELWATPLAGEEVDGEDAEELRIAYVALTRAERYCAVALPLDLAQDALMPYLNVGFVAYDE
jgi:superfamily I DNA/RNA helicase